MNYPNKQTIDISFKVPLLWIFENVLQGVKWKMKNKSLSESFGSRWVSKVKITAYYKTMEVFFDLACQPVVGDSQNQNMNLSLLVATLLIFDQVAR